MDSISVRFTLCEKAKLSVITDEPALNGEVTIFTSELSYIAMRFDTPAQAERLAEAALAAADILREAQDVDQD